MSEVTVGIDIGTSSVKALAVDGEGTVVASARVPHDYRVPAPERLEHDARVAWHDGPLAALGALGVHAQHTVRGVCVAAMVPSLTAVDAQGTPLLPGLLYGDERGRDTSSDGGPATGMEFGGFVRWATAEAPGAAGLWPAQAVANHALAGAAAIDMMTASTAYPVYDFTSWDAELAAQLGARVEQFPTVLPPGAAAGTLPGDGGVLASGCIDAMGEQLVAGADEVGDVLVLLGTTLIVWVVAGSAAGEAPGYVVLPDPGAGKARLGGPSNAGGIFCDWVARLVGPVGADATVEPDRVPVWAPYPRGERSPLNDPSRRATLDRLDLTHDAAAVRRAAYEASGFVVRRAIDAARAGFASEPQRIVASGGGSRVDAWVQAIADATGLPVDCVAVPDGAALGAAWFARIAAGLEDAAATAEARRWARTGRRIEPRAEWSTAVGARYERFRALSDGFS